MMLMLRVRKNYLAEKISLALYVGVILMLVCLGVLAYVGVRVCLYVYECGSICVCVLLCMAFLHTLLVSSSLFLLLQLLCRFFLVYYAESSVYFLYYVHVLSMWRDLLL